MQGAPTTPPSDLVSLDPAANDLRFAHRGAPRPKPVATYGRALKFGAMIALAIVLSGISLIATSQVAQDPPPVPEGLKGIPVPRPSNLATFVSNNDAAIRLGKALFWDMQLGSDGKTACASCHFDAGADSRARHQLSPGLNRMASPTVPNPDTTIQLGGLNYKLKLADFPFHQFVDPNNASSGVVRSVNDVSSSQGVFNERFVSATAGAGADARNVVFDPVFNIGSVNVRKVEPRNSPTVINAVFNFRNFWDGRAQYLFNGVNPFGARDPNAVVYSFSGTALSATKVLIDNASLASQASGPPLSDFEMSAAGRRFMDIGRRVLPARPLATQNVSTSDSVLGGWAVANGVGLNTTYADMVKAAFQSRWWAGTQIVQINADGTRTILPASNVLAPNQYTHMEANFSLLFSLALQMYQATLVSDDSPFDKFMAGGPSLTPDQAVGMGLFFGKGKCANCHGGAEFTNASVRKQLQTQLARMVMGDGGVAVYDEGFYNIAVTPTLDDILVGGNDPFGQPLSNTALAQLKGNAVFTTLTGLAPNLTVAAGERIAVLGAAKTPTVRNAELTAPYFHNGSVATLRQVVEFYNRGGNFANANRPNLDADIQPLGLTDKEMNQLVEFIRALTDERVRRHAAPFDHPQLMVPNGHTGSTTSVVNAGNGNAKDEWLEVKAVGRDGYSLAQRPASFVNTISAPAAAPRMGLLASYFGNRELAGAPTLQRTEAVDFNFNGQSPAPGLEGQNWGARWEGYIVAPEAGSYVFQTRSDDGVRLRLGDVLLINRWNDHLASDDTTTAIYLNAGQRLKVVLEYYQSGGGSEIRLRWKKPGSTIFEPIPDYQMDPESVTTPVYPYAGRGLLAQYFSNVSLSGTPVLERFEAVQLDLGAGSPAPGVVPADNYSVRWQGTVMIPATGSYVFQTRADDGVRLWVNGQLLINDWNSWLARDQTSVALSFTAGQQITVVLEYFEAGGDSSALLRWKPPGATTFGLIPQTLMNPPAGY